MTTLPVSFRRLLTGRIAAIGMFLLLVHAGTSGLGCLFLPAVADQRCGYFRQLLAQVIAVSLSGGCIVAALIALQALLLWMPRGRFAEITRGVTRVCLLTGLMTILFLFPLTAHYLGQLVRQSDRVGIVRWLPTFWFLGIYDSIMWGDHAPLVFHMFAKTGVLCTIAAILLAAFTYPLGYSRRVQQVVEGSPLSERKRGSDYLRTVLDQAVFVTPRTRATAYFVARTLLRIERLHLYLAMYVGLGTALVLSSVLALRTGGLGISIVFQRDGLRAAVPLVAFWAVAGLKMALLSPIGRRGSWIFRAINGTPGEEELRGGRRLTACVACAATLLTSLLLDASAPRGVPGTRAVVMQLLFGCGLTFLLTEIFFARTRSAPFTGIGQRSVYALPFAFVRYFVLLPAFVLSVAAVEAWAAASTSKTVCAAVLLGGTYVCARSVRVRLFSLPASREELTLLTFHDD